MKRIGKYQNKKYNTIVILTDGDLRTGNGLGTRAARGFAVYGVGHL